MTQFSSTDELTAISAALADQYEVEREIGRGGMGVVYLARDHRLDRMVAIKTLPAHLSTDPAVRSRFIREAKTAARLSHPNIVPVYRAGESGDLVFFTMAFVDGESIAERLTRGPFPASMAVPILRDVASALGHAHRSGVIHRDVKTENILLDRITGRAMVSDFGIARVPEAMNLTATGQVLGTVYYLSPEQVVGEVGDARGDIYALGVVAYAMLSGRFPFDGPVASAVLVAHVTRHPKPLTEAAPAVPSDLAAIVHRCLARNPADRFQTCAELDEALSKARLVASADEPQRAPMLTTGTSHRRPASPLLSDTEARNVLKRAAELDDDPSMPSLPVTDRDVARDAARTSGFRTTNLREAAREAGIAERHVERALAERGLRRAQPPAKAGVTTDLLVDASPPPGFGRLYPRRLIREVVIQGEVDESDFYVIAESVRKRASANGFMGNAASVGRSLTWRGHRQRGDDLQFTLVPRDGRTTLRIEESLERRTGLSKWLTLASIFPTAIFVLAPVSAQQSLVLGLLLWASSVGSIGLVALGSLELFARQRASLLTEMLEAIATEARSVAKRVGAGDATVD